MADVTKNHRVIVTAFGGPEQLQVQAAVGSATPGPGQIVVDLEAAGVNYLDVLRRKGVLKIALPYTPGLEGVGRVRAVGVGEPAGVAVGQRVAWINVPDSYASQVVLPAALAIPVPNSFTTAEALLFQGVTAQYLATEYRNIRPGDRVLVHAAAGGVGHILVQWLKHLGAWVVGTTSSDAKAASVRAAGADIVINYGRSYAFLDQLLELTDGRGVDLAFDSIGAATMPATLKALARGGTAVACGAASGPAPSIEPSQLIEKSIRVAGGNLFSYVDDPTELHRRATDVIDAISAGWLRVGEGKSFDFARAADAHVAIESRATQGKLYLTP